MNIPGAYELIEKKELPEVASTGYLLRHIKTGARVACVENADENKVFSIAFRTPPEKSNGVAHIIEHTVLCGSDKYPTKDPFVELVKGSLNTFLNAMTYPDKTVYPVASCNDKDFKNLMSVYMDAVFHPNIYKTRTFFEQEGWHYELADKDAPLIYNGVVYNEMKGAYSSADDVLGEEIKQALYPDNAYAKDSGGKPADIPSLTYEEYIDFHKGYYHPANSFIYLYGNCDMEERLNWIDGEYLSGYGHIDIDSSVKLQKPFDKPAFRAAKYSITDEESTENNTFLSWNRVVGNTDDTLKSMAMGILEYALMEAPGAPVKENLIKAGIGSDVYGGYNDGFRQPYFNVIAREANESDLPEFERIINDTLKDLVKKGLNKDTLLAGINSAEFRSREADFGGYPKGLIFGLDNLNTWLYNDAMPFSAMEFQKDFDELKKLLKTDYFEKLIETELLNNNHGATVIMLPVKGLNDAEDAALSEKLAAIKASMSEGEIEEIVRHTAELKKFQETPSTEEELRTIPLLSVSDVDRKTNPLYIAEKEIDGIRTIHSDIFTSGISYVNLSFSADCIEKEDIVYAELLRSLLLMLSTKKHTYEELGNEILIKTGGIGASLNCLRKNEKPHLRFEISMKCLKEQLPDGVALMDEIMNETEFTDMDRIHELISANKSRLMSVIMERGDMVGSNRAASYFAAEACIKDMQGGIDQYLALDDWDKNFEKYAEILPEKLKKLSQKIFNRNNLIIDYTGTADDYETFKVAVRALTDKLDASPVTAADWKFELKKKNEAFKTSSQVNYVCRSGNFKLADPENKYTGALTILNVWLSYEYLWINIRVKGGAYGCNAQFSKQGAVRFTSYRDPKIRETSDAFLKAADAIEHMEVSDRDMTKYILGAVNVLDAPQSPARKGQSSFLAYLLGVTEEKLQKNRNQILDATVDDLRALAKLVRDAMAQDYLCVVGNAKQIEENSDMFGETVSIFA